MLTHKSQPCKRACLVPTLPGHLLLFGTHIFNQVTKTKGEHTTGSLLLCWQTNIFSASYRYQPISSRRNSISFCCYLHHQFFNQQRLRAGHYKIPAQQQALSVVRHTITVFINRHSKNGNKTQNKTYAFLT